MSQVELYNALKWAALVDKRLLGRVGIDGDTIEKQAEPLVRFADLMVREELRRVGRLLHKWFEQNTKTSLEKAAKAIAQMAVKGKSPSA